MPRQNRRRSETPEDDEGQAERMGRGATRREAAPDGDWLVRPVTGAAATKTYRCPGCDQEVPPGTAHVVAWPDDGAAPGLERRRHWHTACWNARGRRQPRTMRSRNAPRY
jgi:hypothetical protein